MSTTGTTPAPGGEASSADNETPGMPIPTSTDHSLEPLPSITPAPSAGTGPVPAPGRQTPPRPLSSSSSSSCPPPPPSVYSAAAADSSPVPMPPPPPAAQPLRVRARRTGARRLDIHIRWDDDDGGGGGEPAAAASSAPAAAVPAATTGPPPEPANAGVRPPPTPYKSPAPTDAHPSTYVIAPYQAAWGIQAPVPALVTNPPLMAPSVPAPAPGSARWCYATHDPSPFRNRAAYYYYTSPQPAVFPPAPAAHTATPIYTTPAGGVIFYPTG